MREKLGWIALIALLVTAGPLAAQQDTSMAGREREGVGAPGAAGQPQAPDTAGLTERQGLEGDVTDRAAAEEDTMDDMDDEGGAMPTTASPLAALVLSGAALVAIGAGLKLAFGRRS